MKKQFLGGLLFAVVLGAITMAPASACTRYSSGPYDGGGGYTCWDSFLLCSNGHGGMTFTPTYTVCEGLSGPA
jgi:hypothetical protein